jgi:1-deoxy-D-xylulose-5-phosphate reductoisomerase
MERTRGGGAQGAGKEEGMNFRTVSILGATGSIGRQALDVIRHLRGAMEVVALSAGNRIEELAAQVAEFRPQLVHVGNAGKIDALRALLPKDWDGRLLSGPEGLLELAAEAPADLVLVATVGWVGLEPALAAISAGRHIALANKEVMVCGGHLVTAAARKAGVSLLPVDSEHNAIFQVIGCGRAHELRRLILTCSGGPFRMATREVIDAAGPQVTLRHPTWDMGSKITVDSATLMNKGFEVIEAHHLFDVSYDNISVVVHPQSIVHSMVEFRDGSIVAQLGRTDMRLPIQNVLTWPDRVASAVEPLDFAKVGALTFEEPDTARFPALRLAYEAGRTGGSAPCVLNAANEVAVALHLEGAITCGAIARILGAVMERHAVEESPTLEALRGWDRWGREAAREEAAAYSGR